MYTYRPNDWCMHLTGLLSGVTPAWVGTPNRETGSGVGSNLQVRGHNAGAGGKIFDVPPHFSLVPPTRGGTTIVCYRLRYN